MAMKLYEVWIKSVSPMLQHRFSENAEVESGKQTRRVQVKRGTPREEAEKVAHRDKSGEFYFPGSGIMRALREAGGSHKQKGSRKSLKYLVPAAVIVLEENMPLFVAPPNGVKSKPTRITEFEVDSRPVRIRATGGTIMRHRPRLDEWAACFTLRINDDVMDADTIQQLLTESGLQQGLGDFRPSSGGPFGTFSVVSWKEINK